jgi:6-phosphogluconolactonase
MHRRLARWRDRLDWSRVHLFWGDDRFVPHDDPGSNYRMARETLLDTLALAPAQVHPIPADAASADAAARAYEEELRAFCAAARREPPGIDLAVQGMGDDGHTASVFPGSEALWRTDRLVVGAAGPPPYRERVTFTLHAINACRCVLFLVEGTNKAALVRQILKGARDPAIPASMVRPGTGCLIWCVDREAHGTSGDPDPERDPK